MKQFFLLLIALLMAGSVYADCKANGLSVFPSGRSIKQNSIFILDGYAQSQTIILGLNTTYNIYLKSGDKRIKLLVSEVCIGEFYVTQAVLKPETELEAGFEYTMCIDGLPEYEALKRYNTKNSTYEPITYHVISGEDTEKPQVLSQPKELKKTLVYFGCGPSISVVFDSPAKDSSPLIVRTTVKNIKTGKETTYYIEPYKNTISVGHGMCSGAFNFDKNDDYEVEFSFMDASGNVTAWIGERIKFTKPTKETREE